MLQDINLQLSSSQLIPYLVREIINNGNHFYSNYEITDNYRIFVIVKDPPNYRPTYLHVHKERNLLPNWASIEVKFSWF